MSDSILLNLHITKPPSPIIIFGAGGHAISIANIILSIGYKIRYFVDDEKFNLNLLGYKIMKNINALDLNENLDAVVAIGDNFKRNAMHEKITNKYPNIRFPKLIHPSAIISEFSEVGEGTVVMPGAIVGSNTKIGRFCIINTSASIDHDGEMLDYSSLAPAVVTGGSVKIGVRSAISIGAVVKQGVTIGNDCVLGASSYLSRNLKNNLVAYGTPAKIIRNRDIGESYLN